jgi:hypothetical protein
MCEERSNLTEEAQADPTLTKPYGVHMLSEAAQYKEVQNIYATASPETRAVYELGQYTDGLGPFGDRQGPLDNWIIRWCLWHVFRYRDDRNRHHRDRAQAAAVVIEIQSPNLNVPGLLLPTLRLRALTADRSARPHPGAANIDILRSGEGC